MGRSYESVLQVTKKLQRGEMILLNHEGDTQTHIQTTKRPPFALLAPAPRALASFSFLKEAGPFVTLGLHRSWSFSLLCVLPTLDLPPQPAELGLAVFTPKRPLLTITSGKEPFLLLHPFMSHHPLHLLQSIDCIYNQRHYYHYYYYYFARG